SPRLRGKTAPARGRGSSLVPLTFQMLVESAEPLRGPDFEEPVTGDHRPQPLLLCQIALNRVEAGDRAGSGRFDDRAAQRDRAVVDVVERRILRPLLVREDPFAVGADVRRVPFPLVL